LGSDITGEQKYILEFAFFYTGRETVHEDPMPYRKQVIEPDIDPQFFLDLARTCVRCILAGCVVSSYAHVEFLRCDCFRLGPFLKKRVAAAVPFPDDKAVKRPMPGACPVSFISRDRLASLQPSVVQNIEQFRTFLPTAKMCSSLRTRSL
jgi:hypothetical protein